MHELTYPILQGFDSVKIHADIEMGGTDQLFNCTMGRQLQEAEGLSPQVVMCMPLLKGLDGKAKMSKSLNNTIGLIDHPNEMFGKMMSIPDAVVTEYLDLVTDFDQKEKQQWIEKLKDGENPMAVQKVIARNIITQYHSVLDAENAEEFFKQQFQNKSFEEKNFILISASDLDMEDNQIPILDLCQFLKRDESRSALKRLIESGAIAIDDCKITDSQTLLKITKSMKVRIGKEDILKSNNNKAAPFIQKR